jgi:hypothetical protein
VGYTIIREESTSVLTSGQNRLTEGVGTQIAFWAEKISQVANRIVSVVCRGQAATGWLGCGSRLADPWKHEHPVSNPIVAATRSDDVLWAIRGPGLDEGDRLFPVLVEFPYQYVVWVSKIICPL